MTPTSGIPELTAQLMATGVGISLCIVGAAVFIGGALHRIAKALEERNKR